jgi:hypothetical protein
LDSPPPFETEKKSARVSVLKPKQGFSVAARQRGGEDTHACRRTTVLDVASDQLTNAYRRVASKYPRAILCKLQYGFDGGMRPWASSAGLVIRPGSVVYTRDRSTVPAP